MKKIIKISMIMLAFALLSTGYVSAKEKCCDKEGKDSKVKTCDCKGCENCKCGCKEGKECKCKGCKDCKCGCKGDKECDCKNDKNCDCKKCDCKNDKNCDCKKGDCKKGEKSGCGCKDKDAKKGHDDCPHKKKHYNGK